MAAAADELVTTRNSRHMLVGGFRVAWDTCIYTHLILVCFASCSIENYIPVTYGK
jgi:hypothetical protein